MSTQADQYDYIIAGAGSSGLSLAWRMAQSLPPEVQILVVDRELETENDKTWCFWEKELPVFNEIVHKTWTRSDIFVNETHLQEELREFSYHCIRSGDFRAYVFDRLTRQENVTLLETPITGISGNEERAQIHCKEGTFTADYIFQSVFTPSHIREPEYPLVQHFLGWDLRTSSDCFDPESFILMDFDDTYHGGLAFMYVLPWTKRTALLEYTIFSREPDAPELYQEKIELYLYNRYGIKKLDYHIDRVEFGKIPMDDGIREAWYAPRVLNLGANAGLTKPSTGYTFRRIQQHSDMILDSLLANGKPAPAPRSELRYRKYDLWLLQILHDHPGDARKVFAELFKNNTLDEVFRFLGEETNFRQDLNIMYSVPWWPFLRAIWQTRPAILG